MGFGLQNAHTHTIGQKFLENVQLSEVFFVLWTVSFIITKIIEKFEILKTQI